MKLIFIKKRWLFLVFVTGLVAISGWYMMQPGAITTIGSQIDGKQKKFVINLVTGEFKATTEDGREIEAYRWDPGTINVPQGEKVTLSIYGVNGKEHPFIIEGTDYKGTVKKGKETVLEVLFEEEGIYRLICLAHPDIKHNGPMIAYIVVD